MIHYPSELLTGTQLKENIRGYTPEFPYAAFQSEFDRYADRQVSWHWHDTFEFVVVVQGAMELCTQESTYRIGPGEGYFVNTNVLHLCRALDGMGGVVFHTQLFDRALIGGAGLVDRKYIGPLAACSALEVVKLFPARMPDSKMIGVLESAFEAARGDTIGHEMQVCALLTQAFCALYLASRETVEAERRVPRMDTLRVKAMLTFIRAHYSEEITPRQIAAAADVCEREGFRCFRSVLGTTPLASLTEHRINMAARMLMETDKPITEIATACGFATSSYFGKIFRQKMHCAPGVYRRRDDDSI